MNQLVEINGTLYMNTTLDDGSTKLIQVVYVNGIAYLNITYDDGSSKLLKLEEYLNQTQQYIKEHESLWSTDVVGGGISIGDVVSLAKEAVNWLISKANHWLNHENEVIEASEQAKQFGEALDSYFASDLDVYLLQQKINELNIRVIALEKTMNKIASDAYCQGKIDTMMEYNLSWVKCGEKTTYYWRVDPNQYRGYNVIGITPVEAKIESANVSKNVSQNLIANISIVNFQIGELREGENSSAFVTVKNFGNATGSARVFLEVPKDWNYEPKEVNVTLEPGEEKTVEFLVQVPSKPGETARITGLLTFLMGGEKVEIGEAKDVKIVPKVTPLQSITGYATLVFTYPQYFLIFILAIIAISLQLIRIKFYKTIRRKGMAFFNFFKRKRKKERKK
jgi:hypothetical protein